MHTAHIQSQKEFSVKTSIKLAIAGVALFGATTAANAANITNLTTNSTGSDLVLLVKDTVANTFYVQDLGVTVGALNSLSTLTSAAPGVYSADVGATTAGSLTVPSVFANFSSTNLNAYLNPASGTHNFVWSIMGGSAGNGTSQQGQQSVVTTDVSATNYLDGTAYIVGSDVSGGVTGVNGFFKDDINNAVLTNGSNSTAGLGDANTIYGAASLYGFLNANEPTNAKVGVGQFLYQVVQSAGTAGANIYKSLATLTLNSNGTITYSAADLAGGGSPVPLPAAAWLLGSGLMGLAGIGRRKKLQAA